MLPWRYSNKVFSIALNITLDKCTSEDTDDLDFKDDLDLECGIEPEGPLRHLLLGLIPWLASLLAAVTEVLRVEHARMQASVCFNDEEDIELEASLECEEESELLSSLLTSEDARAHFLPFPFLWRAIDRGLTKCESWIWKYSVVNWKALGAFKSFPLTMRLALCWTTVLHNYWIHSPASSMIQALLKFSWENWMTTMLLDTHIWL